MVIVADSHAGHLDPVCEAALMEFISDFKPTVRVHLGDAWDLAALRKGADETDRAVSIRDDFDAAKAFLKKFYSGGKENYYMEGNHDRVRLEHLLGAANALVREAAEDGIKEMDQIHRANRCKVFPYDSRHGVLRLGHLKMIHGYHHGVAAVRQCALVYGGNTLMGHIHAVETVAVPNLDGPAEARCIGTLSNLNPSYASRTTGKLRHSQGWAYGLLNDDGTYTLFQVRNINGKFTFVTKRETNSCISRTPSRPT
jgi:hypothetical protein